MILRVIQSNDDDDENAKVLFFIGMRHWMGFKKSHGIAIMVLGIVVSAISGFAGTTNDLVPWADDFEGYTNGTPLVNGTNGWHASSAAVAAQDVVVDTGTMAAKIPFDCSLSNYFVNMGSTNMWVEMRVRPRGYDGTLEPDVNTNIGSLFHVSSNGFFVVHDGDPVALGYTNWLPILTNVMGADITPLNTNWTSWVLVDFYNNYSNRTWSLFVDGELIKTNIGFVNTNISSFSGFGLYNGAMTTYVDNVWAGPGNPPGIGEKGSNWLPYLVTGQGVVTQFVMEGAIAASNTFEIWKTNGPFGIVYSNTSEISWAHVVQTNGSSDGLHQTIAIVYDTAGLTAQTQPYIGTVTVCAVDNEFGIGAMGSPGTVLIHMYVKALAGVILDSLSQVYDGTPRLVTASTTPSGISNSVYITYDGATNVPVNAGSYAVTGLVSDVDFNGTTYVGMATGTLLVEKADQAVTFTPLIGEQITTNHVGLAATAASGGVVAFSVASGPALISSQTNLEFTGTGEVVIVATQPGNANYKPGAATNIFQVVKAVAGVTLDNLVQIYDGSFRPVTATTTPQAGLPVDMTYGGATNVPVNAGSYSVTGAVNHAMYEGSATGTLVVSNANQAIIFPAIGAQLATNSIGLAATSGSGLAVAFSVESGPAVIGNLTNLTFTAGGLVRVVAVQPGNTNWNGAPAITNSFNVTTAPATVILDGLQQAYCGAGRVVTVDTAPTGLTVVVTYDGGLIAPIEIGSYSVIGTIAGAQQYSGSAAGTLVIFMAAQAIDFPSIPKQNVTNIVILTATVDTGKPLVFSVRSGPAMLGNGSNLSFTGTGIVNVVASQAGDEHYLPAAVTNQFEVTGSGKQQYVPGDYTGDGQTEMNVYCPLEMGGYWFSRTCEGRLLLWDYPWGCGFHMTPVCGDFDGDGVGDPAMYDENNGAWYIISMSGQVLAWADIWGGPGFIPVSGDYDGDGQSDLAVYNPLSGEWYVIDAGQLRIICWATRWGGEDFVPVPGDYDGDGIWDLAVYNQAIGSWFIRTVAGSVLVWNEFWGGPELIPVLK